MRSKKCTKCGEDKNTTEFHRQSKQKDGLHPWCKSCVSAYGKSEKRKLSQAAYRKTDARKEVLSRYNKSSKGKANVAKYRDTNKGRQTFEKAYSKYRETDKFKTALKRSKHKRRSKVQDAGTYTNEQWQERLAEYNYCCAYCYKPFSVEQLTVDHMQPLSRGGTNTIDNLVPACKSCNSRKNTNTPLEMLQKGFM